MTAPAPATPIRRQLMRLVLLTSGLVLLVTTTAFLGYDAFTFRQTAIQQLSTLGKVIAANSTAALAFDNPDDAKEILTALRAERHVMAAVLYDAAGRPFAQYPESLAADLIPRSVAPDGYRFWRVGLEGVEPIVEGGGRRLGSLYLLADTGAFRDRIRLFGGIAVLVMAGAFFLAYLLSRRLQEQISAPILALAETARAISDRHDYSVRARKLGDDELGLLTDAFNQMLDQIHQQNQTLKGSEGRIRAVLNAGLSAAVVTDDRGAITDWTSRAEALFGWTAAEAIGRDLPETILPPGERGAYGEAVARSEETAAREEQQPAFELRAWRRDRVEFPVECSVSPIRIDAGTRYCSFITDITGRKVAEERLQAQVARHHLLNRITRAIGERLELESILDVLIHRLEDNLPIDFGCVCLYDPDRDALTMAAVGAQSVPLAKELGLEGGASFPAGQNGLKRCLQGNLVYEPDLAHSRSDFLKRLSAAGLGGLVVAPLLVESQVFGLLMVARRAVHSFSSADCEFLRQLGEHVALAAHQAQVYSALQRAYDELRQSQQTVLQQERLSALGQMASGIAHDINNAISPVVLYTQALLEQEPGLSSRAREYLETIERAIDDVAATVARMREFYRPREAQLTLSPASLNTMARQVLDLTRPWWADLPQKRGIMIETRAELAPGLPPVMAAEGEVREALTNLVFNAVDAMTEGGTLTLRSGVRPGLQNDGAPAGPERVFIEVEDTGQGMDEQTRRRCLEPFYTTKGERGTGLGLAMVYGMVQRHGAEIEIDSALGRGTTMRIIFGPPVAAASAPARKTAAPAPPTRLRILAVDDDPLVLKAVRDALETDGHLVTTAQGGREGIAAFESALGGLEAFSVVITDLGMPHVDGRQVASAVKAASPSTQVILLTGWGQRMLAESEVPPYVDHLLNKPPKVRDLRETLALCAEATARE